MLKFHNFCLSAFMAASMLQPAMAQDQPEKPIEQLWSSLSKSRQDTSRVTLLLQLSDHYFPLPGRTKFDLDSAMAYARSAEAISIRLGYQPGLGDSYEQISKILHIRKSVDSGRYYANKAVGIFKSKSAHMALGYAYYDLSGYYLLYDSDINKRIALVEQALSEFQQARDKKKEADVHKELGDLRQINGDYTGALSDLRQAVQLYHEVGYPYLQGAYDLMGYILSGEGDFEEGLKYGLLAVDAAEQVKDTASPQMCTIYNRVGATYERMKKLQPAYDYYQKSIAIAIKCKDTASIVVLTCNISHDLVKLNKPHQALAVLLGLTGYPRRDYMEGIMVAGRFLDVYDCLNQGYKGEPYCDQL